MVRVSYLPCTKGSNWSSRLCKGMLVLIPSTTNSSSARRARMMAAGLLSVVIFPALGLALLRREQPRMTLPSEPRAPVMPVLTAEDRALCRVQGAATAA